MIRASTHCSWFRRSRGRGTLAQYVGRLHREHEGKAEVRVYDYVDANVPVLARMAARRRVGYKALGYTIE
jgi:superfamily II DNA or RNA helicase